MPELTILSLGWGVQSWTLAAMSALGQLPPVDLAIHSDTSWERRATYAFAAQWTAWLEQRGVAVVTTCDQRAYGQFLNEWGGVFIPAYTLSARGKAQLHRQCTDRWKIRPMRRRIVAELARRGLQKLPGVVEVDRRIRHTRPPHPLFVHPARVPLPDAVRLPEDHGVSQLALLASHDDDAQCDSGFCFL